MKKIDKEKLNEKKEKLKNNKVGKSASEFRDFIMRGDVVDLAVGVIIGGAFGKIVTSLVNDILMPIIGILIGGIDFSNLSVNVLDAKIMYGSFIQQIIDFLIVALCIFLFIKLINKITRKDKREAEKKAKEEAEKKAKEEAEKNKKSDEAKLLEEIRDLLKEKNNK